MNYIAPTLMKPIQCILIISLLIFSLNSCKQSKKTPDINILYLHHSIGGVIWRGGKNSFVIKVADKINPKIADLLDKTSVLPKLLNQYNKANATNYYIEEMDFPKEKPYGWKNYPFDYYNIWIKNAGDKPFLDEPTLEMLTEDYQVIIFKHCFPVSNIKPDLDTADIDSELKTISNYKLQYLALRDKLHEFPETKFILFTGAAQVETNIKEEDARRAKEFFNWVTDYWDLPEDNIYLWDLYSLQTEGNIYFKNEYALSSDNSHPNKAFAERAVRLLLNRIIEVIENNETGTGEHAEGMTS